MAVPRRNQPGGRSAVAANAFHGSGPACLRLKLMRLACGSTEMTTSRRVSRNALKAHLKHGDTIGPCSTATFTLCQKAKTKKVKGEKKAEKLLRKGAKLGKCKQSKSKSNEHGKGSEQKKKEKGKPADTGKPADPGKPADTPGKGGDKGKKK